MWTPRSEVIDNAQKLGISIREIFSPQAQEIRQKIVEAYFNQYNPGGRLFEKMIDQGNIVSIENTPQRLVKVVGEGACLVFFEKEEYGMFEIKNIHDFLSIYEEIANFTIYLTNWKQQYIFVISEELISLEAGQLPK